MFLFKLFLALIIVVAVLLLVFRFRKQIRSDILGAATGVDKGQDRPRAPDLEEFIAAYRRERASKHAQADQEPSPSTSASAATAVAAAGKARAAFLSGPAKLAFLVLKAGLPDHHIFAHTSVSALIDANAVPALANLPIDLLVCSKELAIVAAVDLSTGAQSDALVAREKEQRLRGAGIRYLRFAPDALPKPVDVRALVYGQ